MCRRPDFPARLRRTLGFAGVDRIVHPVHGRIRLRVGPAPSAIAKQWIANRRAFVEAARRTTGTNRDALDLLEVFLGLWSDAAERSETFDWESDLDQDVLLLTARHWLDLGEITTADREAMGVPPQSPEAEQFTQVVVRGIVAALSEAGAAGSALLA